MERCGSDCPAMNARRRNKRTWLPPGLDSRESERERERAEMDEDGDRREATKPLGLSKVQPNLRTQKPIQQQSPTAAARCFRLRQFDLVWSPQRTGTAAVGGEARRGPRLPSSCSCSPARRRRGY